MRDHLERSQSDLADQTKVMLEQLDRLEWALEVQVNLHQRRHDLPGNTGRGLSGTLEGILKQDFGLIKLTLLHGDTGLLRTGHRFDQRDAFRCCQTQGLFKGFTCRLELTELFVHVRQIEFGERLSNSIVHAAKHPERRQQVRFGQLWRPLKVNQAEVMEGTTFHLEVANLTAQAQLFFEGGVGTDELAEFAGHANAHVQGPSDPGGRLLFS